MHGKGPESLFLTLFDQHPVLVSTTLSARLSGVWSMCVATDQTWAGLEVIMHAYPMVDDGVRVCMELC